MKLKDTCSWKKSNDKPNQCIEKQRHYFAHKGPSSQSYGFSSIHAQIWELDHKESWVLKNWYFQIVVLEKTLDSPLDNKEIKPVNPKVSHHWIFIGKTDSEAKAPILWPPDVKSWLTGKIEGKMRREWQRMRWLDSIIDSMAMTLSKLWEIVKDRGALPAAAHEITKSQTWLLTEQQ